MNNRGFILFAAIFFLLLFAGAFLYYFYFRIPVGPEQPIHFSHRIHANVKGISCFMCHDGAIETERAIIPPLQTCMLCHQRIIIHHPEVENLRSHFYNKIPVEWKRLQNVPDFVYFDHSVHIQSKVDCSRCHGNIKGSDRIVVNRFKMGFCIGCHKDNNATLDCFTCHR